MHLDDPGDPPRAPRPAARLLLVDLAARFRPSAISGLTFEHVTRHVGGIELFLSRHFVARISSWAKSALRIDIYLRRTYSGRPSFSIRLSDATAMATSVVCRPSVRERSASPITRL